MSLALKKHLLSKSSRRTSSAGGWFKPRLATDKGAQLFAPQTIPNEGKAGLLVTRWKPGQLASVPVLNRDFI